MERAWDRLGARSPGFSRAHVPRRQERSTPYRRMPSEGL